MNQMKIVAKIILFIERFIEKHHRCDNNSEIYSCTFHTDAFGIVTLLDMKYKCSICGEIKK
jgi:hypothetical protein